jgi:hypothetical protein
MHDLSMYGDLKLNTSIEELNEKQGNTENHLKVLGNDAASLEISELARMMYASSDLGNQTAADTQSSQTTAGEKTGYEGLSSAEREVKELEDWIASHPVDKSIDMAHMTGSLKEMQAAAVNLSDNPVTQAGNTYRSAFSDAAAAFADFSGKITSGAYSQNDVSVSDLNFDALDQMQQLYKDYESSINASYTGSEREAYLNQLNQAYDQAFQSQILDPIKKAYDDKLYFYRPDSEETMSSIRATSTSMDNLNTMVSNYLASQAIDRKYTDILTDGTKDFYALANDSSKWHDTDQIKNVLTDSMNVYSSVKEVTAGSAEREAAKAAADAAAKKISDQYAEQLAYREEKLGLTKNGELVYDESEQATSISNYITGGTGGFYVLDFGKIPDIESLIPKY